MTLLSPKSRILFATHTRPEYMPPPAYTEHMIICSPYYPNSRNEKGDIQSLSLPEKKQYNLAGLINSLPESQQPDLVIIRLDSTFQHIPGNIKAISQPTIAMIGDTHHMCRPLQSMLGFLLQEHFDYLLIDHTPQHSHWFTEAGLSPLYWLPGTLLADTWIKPCSDPQAHVAFIGQMGKAHPVRNSLLEGLQQADIPLSVLTAPQKIACRHYNKAAITFNHSLNGDFNLRVFETLASGGFLLTEELESQAGQDTIFTDGEHLVYYRGIDDLIAKCKYYLNHTQERNRIARAGHLRVKKLFSIKQRMNNFQQLLSNSPQNLWRPEDIDGRAKAYGCRSRDDLFQRAAIYEWIQEQHRTSATIYCHVSPSADPRIVCDMADLPRLKILLDNNHAALKMAEDAGIKATRFTRESADTNVRNIQLLAAKDLTKTAILTDSEAIIISDWQDCSNEQQAEINQLCAAAELVPTNFTEGLFLGLVPWSDVWNKPPHT